MNRFQMFLTQKQTERLRKLAERTGLSIAEHIRRAIDEYKPKQTKKESK